MVASGQPLLLAALLVGAGLVLLAAEARWPRRPAFRRATRWRTHIGFMLVNLPLERGVQALVLIALYGAVSGYPEPPRFGLFALLALPPWLVWTASVLLLDLAVWAQHWLTHRVPLLWRLHRVHHADPAIDLSTALRFHPIEIGLSMLYKMAAALLLGVPLGALVLFELLLAVAPLFNHANLALPGRLDAALRLLVVTPDMHRVHHSSARAEQDSNFGFCFALWDRMLGTYCAQPARGHARMAIGIADAPEAAAMRFGWAMALPFRRAVRR